MNQEQQEQLEFQRNIWNQFSAGWKKWDELLMNSMRPVSAALIDALQLKGNEHVLDVASGTGEPGLTLSAALPNGSITGTDLSERMVEIAVENAEQRGITNYRSQACDVSHMPFENNSFNHVICRFGIMFFPDIKGSLIEMTRVLKHGGRLVVAVWAAHELNPFITLMAMTVMKKLDIPKPPPDTPGIFRCAQPGLTSQLLESAGLSGVTEYNLKGEATFDSPQQYWDVMSDVAGPIMQALNNAPHEVVEDVKATVINEIVNYKRDDGKVYTDYEAIVATGVKE